MAYVPETVGYIHGHPIFKAPPMEVPRDCRCPDCYLWLHDRCLYYEVRENWTTALDRNAEKCPPRSEKPQSRARTFDKDGAADE
ncbi:unnamed protein product [marine sediment metagenome]|uniref:Uncharacterized protein n=1 Tax=marine sediment metagenome TaxID=412755 RepID=X0ZTL9_9ZZZZ